MKYSVEINKSLQEELNGSLKRNSLISIIAGILGVVIYVVVSMFIENFLVDLILYLSAGFFGGGIAMYYTIIKINKKAVESKLVGEYEIFEEYLIVNTKKNGIQISTVKLFYTDIVKIKETENFVFLYADKSTAYPIPKKELTAEELSTAKLWIFSHKQKNK